MTRTVNSIALGLAMAGATAFAQSKTPPAPARDAAFYASRGISFYAPFDQTLNAEYSTGRRDAMNPHLAPLYPQQGIAFTEGKVGRGATAREITLTYDPSKVFFPDRGAVSFWFKPVKGAHRAIFRVPAEEWGVGPNSRLQQELYTDTFLFGPAPLVREGFFRALIRPALDPVDATFNLGDLDPDRWHHFVWTWDNTQGMRGWLDGKVLFDHWGTITWIQMMTPRLILISSVSAVDELVFFNRPLSPADARALAAGSLPDPRPPEETYSIPVALRDHVAHSYGLDELPAYPVVESGAPVTFTPVDFEKAFDGKRPMLYCLDGNRVSCWPDSHIELVNTDYLDIHYPGGVEANYFRVISDGRRLALSMDDEAKPFWVDEVRPERDSWEDKLVRRHFTGEPVRFSKLRLDRKGSRVGEFYVYRVEPRPLAVPGAGARSFGFDQVVDIRSLPWEGAVYQRYHNHASPAAMASSQAGGGRIPGNALVPFHLVSPPFAEKTGVAAVSLEVAFTPPKDKQEDIVRVRIVDPVTRERDLVNTEFRLRFDLSRPGPQIFQLAFDAPDFVYNAGARVWLWLVSKEGCGLSLAESRMTVHTVPVAQAAEPMVAQTLRLIAHTFSHSSEPHVWTRSFKWPGDENHHYTWAEWPALPNLIRERLAPDSRIVGTYWNVIRPITNSSHARWVDYSRSKEVRALAQPRIEGPKSWPNPAGAPEWARFQNELLKSLTRIVHWWHDHRLVLETGVLGGYGDDTQFTGDAFWLYFATGDARLFRILQAVTDGTWKYSGVRRGFPSRINDVAHDAEEVVGTWPLMIVADYGNPRYVEMTMETMSLMDFFTTRSERGHLHFRSWYLGANGVKTEGNYGVDNLANAQFALLGHSLAWYNACPKLTDFYRDWCDAWLDDFARAKAAGLSGPISVRMPDDTPVAHVDAMSPHNLQHHFYVTGLLTGDRKYLDRALGHDDNVFLGSSRGEWNAGMLLRNFAVSRRRLFEDPALMKSTSIARPSDVFTKFMLSRDKGILAGDYKAKLEEFAGQTEYLHTVGQPSLDRLYGLFNEPMFLAMLGGAPSGHRRSTIWPGMAVSFPDAGTDLASLVLDTGISELRLVLFNFNEQRRNAAIRLWHLEAGEYELTAGPDGDGDDEMDAVAFSARLAVRRGARVSVPLPFGTLQAVRIRQISRTELPRLLPDLALTTEDVAYDRRGGSLAVTVHNIGSASAVSFEVRLFDQDGKAVAVERVAGLEAPIDLKPRTNRVRFAMDEGAAANVRRVEVAPIGWQGEITEENNIVRMIPMHLQAVDQ